LPSDRIDARLAELGLTLPPLSKPVGTYLGCKRVGDVLYVGGHGPVGADGIIRGKVGADVSLERAQEAARLTALSMLATVKAELGSLDRIKQIVKVFGMVNCAPGFNRTPEVINGCSDVLVAIFGDAGRHTRSAVGMAELPFDIAVEIEMIAQLETA
jgi:enamine deaminase RidA (YjgF/YER057c/UK114 family)